MRQGDKRRSRHILDMIDTQRGTGSGESHSVVRKYGSSKLQLAEDPDAFPKSRKALIPPVFWKVEASPSYCEPGELMQAEMVRDNGERAQRMVHTQIATY
jgi:hypothetical protein